MTTQDTVNSYFDALRKKEDWESLLSPGMVFSSFISPVKTVTGKPAYIDSTKRFFASIQSMEVRDLLIEGNKACALTRYQLKGPAGQVFQSDVSEIFEVKDGKIVSFSIYFDTAPFPK